jgi:hypothetical protein
MEAGWVNAEVVLDDGGAARDDPGGRRNVEPLRQAPSLIQTGLVGVILLMLTDADQLNEVVRRQEGTVQQRIEDLNDAERDWLASCIDGARQLIAAYSPADVSRPLDADVLDRTYAAWLATGETDPDRVNQVINAVGFAFGQLLVDAAGFRWVVATDPYGCEMALLALPGRGDVLVYPSNMVAKRWQSRETGFLLPLFGVITQQVRDVEGNWPVLPPQFQKSETPDQA